MKSGESTDLKSHYLHGTLVVAAPVHVYAFQSIQDDVAIPSLEGAAQLGPHLVDKLGRVPVGDAPLQDLGGEDLEEESSQVRLEVFPSISPAPHRGEGARDKLEATFLGPLLVSVVLLLLLAGENGSPVSRCNI